MMAGGVFVTGGSGFVGSAVIAELLSKGLAVNALANRGDLKSTGKTLRAIRGGLFNPKALDEGMEGCSAVIHLVGIIAENPSKGITFEQIHVQGTRAVVDAALRCNVKRYIHMSALGSRPGAASRYHQTKFEAEEVVRASSLDWTILRPSLIHGPGGQFMKTEAMWARKRAPAPVFLMPAMPYFGAGILGGGGAGKLQPVYVRDVARAFVEALEKPKTIGEVYLLGGSQPLTWPQLHRIAAESIVGHPRKILPVPVWAAKVYAAIGVAPLLGFNLDQVIMSQEDNTCDLTKFESDFGWTPAAFSQTLPLYAEEI